MKILVVDQDVVMQDFIKKFLFENNHTVYCALSSSDALEIIAQKKPDIVISEINLRKMDGMTLCKIIRSNSQKYSEPFIIMTANDDKKETIVKVLNTGADGFLQKPIYQNELLARINAIHRRKYGEQNYNMRYKNIRITNEYVFVVNGDEEEVIVLFKKELDLFTYLVKNKGILLNREKIVKNVWNDGEDVKDRNVDTYISRIKSKIPGMSESIVMVRGIGYKLEKD